MRHLCLPLIPALWLGLGCDAPNPPPGDDPQRPADPHDDTGAQGDTGFSGELSFTDPIQPILRTYCASCHVGTCNDCFVDRYELMHQPSSSPACAGLSMGECVVQRAGDGSMPPARGCTPGAPRCITEQEYALLQDWVALGMPE